MHDYLATALLGEPKTAKQIAQAIGKSESRTRELLKEFASEIKCRKEEGKNVFWIGDGTPTNTIKVDTAAGPIDVDLNKIAIDPSKNPGGIDETNSDGCPLCGSDGPQVQAGEEGSFLGEARTCSACNRTWNIHERKEVDMAPKSKAKRTPLNPQYKITQKVDAAQKAGGRLVFDRNSREWVLIKKGMDPIRMDAKTFSVETAETITAKLEG